MSRKSISATGAERLFGVVIVLLLVALVADFIFVTNFLRAKANDTETLRLRADASDSDVAKLKSADTWLKRNKEAVERVDAVVAQSKLYQYQNQIIQDLNGYGDQLGIPVSGYSFSTPLNLSSPGAPTAGAAPPVPTAPTTTAPAAQAPTGGTLPTAPKAPAGVNSTTVTVTFGDKVSYTNFLNLLRLVEQNVTRMQVTDISLTPDSKEPSTIINPSITIIVYVK